jgi:hypothetical protein
VFTLCPPLTRPTFTVIPRLRSVMACSACTLRASSSMALIPASKLPPEWAALPSISKKEKTPPLRPVTMPPEGRPGSELNTARASRATDSITSRPSGEPISSSPVNKPSSGAGAPPKRWKAARTNMFITSPAFMSATPGP